MQSRQENNENLKHRADRDTDKTMYRLDAYMSQES